MYHVEMEQHLVVISMRLLISLLYTSYLLFLLYRITDGLYLFQLRSRHVIYPLLTMAKGIGA